MTVYVGNVTVTGGRNDAGISADDTKIYGGHVIATGGEFAAGIGGNQNAPCKAVSIYEGTVIANAGAGTQSDPYVLGLVQAAVRDPSIVVLRMGHTAL